MMNTKPIEKEFIDYMVSTFTGFGMDRVSSKLLAILYLEPKEISMDELAKRTGYSLASISTKAKLFQRLSCFKRLKKPGTKKVYFYMEKDLVKIRKSNLEAAKQSLNNAKNILPEIISKYKNTKLTQEDKQKLKIIKDHYNHVLKMEQLLQKLNLLMQKM